MKTIEFQLSRKSIENAIKELKAYRKSLEDKNKIFMDRLADIGIETMSRVIDGIPEEEWRNYSEGDEIVPYKKREGPENEITVCLRGRQVAFIEFSAGVKFGMSGSAYPTPAGAGMGMGTFPGKGHWKDPHGWWYKDPDNPNLPEGKEYVHTYGNRAYMPVYHAEEEIMMQVYRIAKEVFGG